MPPLLLTEFTNRKFGKDSTDDFCIMEKTSPYQEREKKSVASEMVGWNHQLDGHEFEQATGVGDGQGSWHAAVRGVAKSRTRLSN